jgi:hypothetical protein
MHRKAGAAHVEHRRRLRLRRQVDAGAGEIEHQRIGIEEGHPGAHVEQLVADLGRLLDVVGMGIVEEIEQAGDILPHRSEVSESTSHECARRLEAFVGGLDKMRSANPTSVFLVLDLLKRSFPVTGCDPEISFQICRGSKVFSEISDGQRQLEI